MSGSGFGPATGLSASLVFIRRFPQCPLCVLYCICHFKTVFALFIPLGTMFPAATALLEKKFLLISSLAAGLWLKRLGYEIELTFF